MAEDTGKNVVHETADLTEGVIKAVEAGQRAAIDAVRKFVETMDKAIPEMASATQRQSVIDAALDMADKLVTTQYNFLSSIVRNVERSVSESTEKTRSSRPSCTCIDHPNGYGFAHLRVPRVPGRLCAGVR